MAREKRPYCEHVSGTNNVEMCIGKQVDLTEANYRIFKASIRTDLGPSPGDSETTIFQKNTAVASFDKAEKAWLVYRNRECGALEDSYAGGTIAPSMAVECELKLTRAHMRELHLLYAPQS